MLEIRIAEAVVSSHPVLRVMMQSTAKHAYPSSLKVWWNIRLCTIFLRGYSALLTEAAYDSSGSTLHFHFEFAKLRAEDNTAPAG